MENEENNVEKASRVAAEFMRETDRWLRRMLLIVPIMSFIVGWGCGVMTTFLMYKDHEKRITTLENNLAQSQKATDRIIGLLEDEHKIMLH